MTPCYLTKIEVDYETAFKAGLRDTYAWHQKTWGCFPGVPSAERDFLTRVDETPLGFRLLMLSLREPQRPPWCPTDVWQSKHVPEEFFQHQDYRFSLVANPTKKVRRMVGETATKNGRRIPLTQREELIAWLMRKGTQGGFVVDHRQVQIISRTPQSFIKQGRAGLHSTVEFSGRLHVTDAALFRQAAITGVGSAKAFGFGLLCLAPIESPHPEPSIS